MKSPRLDEKLCPDCGRWGCLFNKQTRPREEWVTPRFVDGRYVEDPPWSTVSGPPKAPMLLIRATMREVSFPFDWSLERETFSHVGVPADHNAKLDRR